MQIRVCHTLYTILGNGGLSLLSAYHNTEAVLVLEQIAPHIGTCLGALSERFDNLCSIEIQHNI